MYIYIIGLALASLLAMWVIRHLLKNRVGRTRAAKYIEYKKDQDRIIVDEWKEKIERARTDEEIQAVGPLPQTFLNRSGDPSFYQERRKYDSAMARWWARSRAETLLENISKAAGPVYEIWAWLALLRRENIHALEYVGIDVLVVKSEIRNIYSVFLEQANSGNQERFLSLRLLLIEPEQCHGDYYVKLPFTHPSNWDDLVTIYIDNPALGDFAYVNKDPEAGEIRLLAAKALRTQSLKDAKVVLAFCNRNSESRAEVGDVFLTKLAKMVDQAHRENRLFAQTEQETM